MNPEQIQANTIDDIIITVILIVIIVAAFLAWYFIQKAKNEERKLLLEKGYDPADLPARSSFSFPWLKLGCVITSGALGLLIGLVIDNIMQIHLDLAGLFMMIFGGVGLIIAHYVDKPNDQ